MVNLPVIDASKFCDIAIRDCIGAAFRQQRTGSGDQFFFNTGTTTLSGS